MKHNFKETVLITSRVHPGESNASFAVQGIIDFLLSNDPMAKKMRMKYLFKIVPMLNPDGVRYGNYRCDIFGYDLNRKWKKPNPNIHAPIHFTK